MTPKTFESILNFVYDYWVTEIQRNPDDRVRGSISACMKIMEYMTGSDNPTEWFKILADVRKKKNEMTMLTQWKHPDMFYRGQLVWLMVEHGENTFNIIVEVGTVLLDKVEVMSPDDHSVFWVDRDLLFVK